MFIKNNKKNGAWQSNIFRTVLSLFLMFGMIFSIILGSGLSSETSNGQEQENIPRANLIISTDTTWTLANSPFNLTGNVLVENGVTLTIDPGVVVRLGKDNYIQIEGRLLSEGTANKMITFTSKKINPSESDYWDAIKFMDDADNGSLIRFCNIEYAIYAIYVDPGNPIWAPYQNAPNITHSYIGNCKKSIIFNSRDPTFSSSNYTNVIEFNIIKNGIEMFFENANMTLRNNIVFGGVFAQLKGGILEIKNNSISGAEKGIHCANSWISDLIITKNFIIGNSDSGIAIGYWANDGVDYIDINNNTIIYNNKGIDFIGAPNKINISNNEIRNNKHGILFPSGYSYFPSPPNFYNTNYNNIHNNSIYNVKNGVPKTWGDWNFKNNWWGTSKPNEINQSIYDYYDDFNLGKILYKPFLTKEVKINKPYNLPPVADAGQDKNIFVNDEIHFDASNSYDPNNVIVSGKWDFGDGNSSNWGINSSYHTYTKPGNYTVTLTVFDGFFYDTDTCWVNVSKLIIPNRPPSLYLPPVEMPEDSYRQQYYDLWDHASDDRTPDEYLNFSIIKNSNPKCGVSIESNRYVTIKPAVNWFGNATVTLRVDDGELNSTCEFKVTVFPVREPPVADAGGNQYAKVNTTITFNGNGSMDCDGDKLIYNWSFGDGTYSGWQNSSNTSHTYKKAGIYKVKLTVNDSEFSASDTCYAWIYLNETSKPPKISNIPDIIVRYYDPNDSHYSGYGYDFSYFINDPDNDVSELTLMVKTEDNELDKYIEIDPNNAMRLIFRFPFETATTGKKHPVYLYIWDLNPRDTDVFTVFNITVIIDNWPVMQNRKIEDQSIDEDGKKDNAFRCQNYFWDEDGGTTYKIITKENGKISADINKDGYVDLESKVKDWYGVEELVLLAHDRVPEQFVYAVFKVKVKPVNDPPVISEIPEISVSTNEIKIINLSEYITDVDTELLDLKFEISDIEHAWVNGSNLYLQYDKSGDYFLTITVIDGEFTVTLDLHINVKKGSNTKPTPTPSEDVDGDLLPDAWELKYGLDPNNASDAQLDLDNDSLTNIEEYFLNTDPKKFDTDGDGYSDKVDEYPNDPKRYKKEIEGSDQNQGLYIGLVLVVVVIIIILLLSLFILKNKPKHDTEPKFTPDDELYSKVMHDIMFDYELNGANFSDDELRAMLDEKLRTGQISQKTYNDMMNLTQASKNSQPENDLI